MIWSILIGFALVSLCSARKCRPSVTVASGSYAPHDICSGALIFADSFDEFDLEKWQHERTLAGGGNWEFQYYNNNRTNSFVKDGKLHIRPSLTSDQFGEAFLTSGFLDVNGGAPADICTDSHNWGCQRTGSPTNVLNPTKSARIRTLRSFNFRYGRVEVRAKMPAGDWLWPAIWLMPSWNAYGYWPASGEIDLVECRGNRDLYLGEKPIGTQQVGARLHFGPYDQLNGWERAQWHQNNITGYDQDFHSYQLHWTPDFISFSIDDTELGRATPGAGGFWEYGGFTNYTTVENPWRYSGKMAPFDQKFYIVINLAVGGVNGFFPDDGKNPTPKPWSNQSPTALTDFWKARQDWLPTWKLDTNEGEEASLQVDYVKVWAL